MPSMKLRRIRHDDAQAAAQLADLRRGMSLQADVVSPRGRELTEHVFGQALTPSQVVERICTDVRRRGLEAVLHHTAKLDKKHLTPEPLRVSAADLPRAHAGAE